MSSEFESTLSRMFSLSGPILAVVSGIVLLIFGNSFAHSLTQSNIIVFSGVGLVFLGATISAYLYLKGNNLKSNIEYAGDDEEKYLNISNSLEFKLDQLISSIEESKEIDSKSNVVGVELSADERVSLIESLKSHFSREFSEQIYQGAKDDLEKRLYAPRSLLNIRKELERTRNRLKEEISALSRRGNLNLLIGGVTTVMAVSLLAYIVLTAQIENGDTNAFIWHYVPRITVAIFIEVFSFFFLRLYRNSLNDIKYFQNELTNIDSKFIALETAMALQDKSVVADILSSLSSTERNSKLGKGESTVELEKLKVEKEGLSQLLSSAKDIIGSVKK